MQGSKRSVKPWVFVEVPLEPKKAKAEEAPLVDLGVCARVYVCVCVCMYVWMYICTYVSMCMYRYLCMYWYVCMYV